MKLAFRITALVASVSALLAAAWLAASALTGSPWWCLGAVIATALVLANVVDEVLGLGVVMGRRQAERERERDEDDGPTLPGMEGMPSGLRKALVKALKERGLTPVSAHRVGADDDEDDDEKEIVERLKAIADEITDPDMKEFAFHFAHIATDCPGSAAHAARMHELVPFIDARLRASTVQPQNDDDRPQVH